MYSPQVLDHFQHPRNAGELASPDSYVRVENPVCGDILELYAYVREGRIAEIRFKAKGCVPAMACASLITEMSEGKSLIAAAAISRKELAERIGGLPTVSGPAAQLAVDALRVLLKQLSTI